MPVDEGGIDSAGIFVTAGVDTGAARLGVGAQRADASDRRVSHLGRSTVAVLSRLDGQGLSHDGAAMSEQLQLGHGSATGRDGHLGRRLDGMRASRGRQRTQLGGRGRLQEGAHGLGLAQGSLHDEQQVVFEQSFVLEWFGRGGTTLTVWFS